MTVNNDHICYIYIIYIIIKTDMNASWMLVYFIIRWWSQGKIIGMSQGKICYKVNFFKRYISMILMHISILFSLVMYSILDDGHKVRVLGCHKVRFVILPCDNLPSVAYSACFILRYWTIIYIYLCIYVFLVQNMQLFK